ncbi:hypothetical protein NA8A_12725 [Nitratireductor indicus C115]|uniref:Uncharacterized protein n=1 Tax=Nitratireductor indicus C115 TaxID=1231190 RepID=K2P3G9_9HYPH|nr:hypothetical protein [Nitratireductor indicus]EKF41936.1 hypothetical protein NA8A_12725 [Nitratireductor indicus C115]SFQ48023.1 hypothetical protein SAMN05216176_104183 [Nitratireductor indicus]
MADFSAVLRKTIDGLRDNTPEARERIYQKARTTIEAKLAAINPPPSAAVFDRQRKSLEDAIASVEADFAPIIKSLPPEDDFDSIFAELHSDPVKKPEPAAPAPTPVTPPKPPVKPEATEPAKPSSSKPEADLPSFDEEQDTSGDDAQTGGGQDREARNDGGAVPPPRAIRPRQKKSSSKVPAIAAGVLLLAAAAAAGGWYYVNMQPSTPGNGGTEVAGQPAETTGQEQGGAPSGDAAANNNGAAQPAAPAQERPRKFTQRLTPDGQEVDEGPAGGEPGLGEGTSVAQATAPSSNDPATAPNPAPNGNVQSSAASAGGDQAVPVGQRAIFYEERTNASQGSADPGSVVWSVVRESPGNDLPPEPVIRAEATVPDKNLQMKLTIRRNADQSLPASHIVEIIFLTPESFEGGGIENVLRVTMKRSEQDTGNPLLGIPAKIADGFFLVALSDSKADEQANLLLMQRQSWIDIPVVYKSGRRALITIEKGIPGDKIFTDVLNAWQNAAAGG